VVLPNTLYTRASSGVRVAPARHQVKKGARLSIDLKKLMCAGRLDEALYVGRRRKRRTGRGRRAIAAGIERHHQLEQQPTRS
jgi:hypothetical protein